MWKITYQYSNSIRDGKYLADRYRPHILKVNEISDGFVLPLLKDRSTTYGLGGVLDKNKSYVRESEFVLPFREEKRVDWGGSYPFDEKDISYYNERVIFAGLINNNEWGHFITDWSVRLWYAIREDPVSRIIFCQRGNSELLENIRKLLEAVGISSNRLMILHEGDMPCSFSKIVIPEPSLTPEGYTDEFRFFFERVAETVRQKSLSLPIYPKIYLTRTGLRPLKDFGEKELESFFEQNGYHVLSPERLSLEEQIHYMLHCEEVASLEGSAAHNIVFARRGVHQIIMEKSQAVNVRQMIICQCCEAEVDFIGTYPKIKFYDYYSYGPFLVGITKKFCQYVEAKDGFGQKPKARVGVWIRNYVRYVVIRVCRRVMFFFRRIRRIGKR